MISKAGTSEWMAGFERRRRRVMPEGIRQGVPPPSTWTASQEDWDELAESAREAFRQQPYLEFAVLVADKGYYPDELASGQLRPGAEIQVVTGNVVRRRVVQDEATMSRARQLRQEMARAGVKLDPILDLDLENITVGAPVGDAKRVRIVMDAAERALRQRKVEQQAAVRERASRPLLTVHRPFRAIAGKQYAPGTYPIDPDVADELGLWRERMESQAKERDLDAPVGFDEASWPPFSIEAPDTSRPL